MHLDYVSSLLNYKIRLRLQLIYLLVEELLIVFQKLIAYLVAMDGLSQLPQVWFNHLY
jgi:hypothetical protein